MSRFFRISSRTDMHMDLFRLKDKEGDTAWDLLSPNDTKIKSLIRKAEAEAAVSLDDVASGA